MDNASSNEAKVRGNWSRSSSGLFGMLTSFAFRALVSLQLLFNCTTKGGSSNDDVELERRVEKLGLAVSEVQRWVKDTRGKTFANEIEPGE